MLDDSGKAPRRIRSELLKAVHQASARSAKVVESEMKRGLGGLATIVSIAPWVGVFGTVLGLCNFRGFNGSNEDGLAYVALTVSEGIVPSAFGLLVGLMANWFYKFLTDKMEVFDSEMESATLQLVNDISRLC